MYEAIDDLDKTDSGDLGDLHYEEEHRMTHLGLGLYGLFSEGVASVKRGYRYSGLRIINKTARSRWQMKLLID